MESTPFATSGPITAVLRENAIEIQHNGTQRKYDLLPSEKCHLCSAPLSGKEGQPELCWPCGYYDDLYGFERALAMAPYFKGRYTDFAIDLLEKYRGNRDGSRRIGVALALFAREMASKTHEADIIVPAPIHPASLERRGFNQTEVMAEELARELRIPIVADVLKKVREGQQRGISTRKGRKENVEGMYVHGRFEHQPEVVLFLDDLMSSGFTASECSHQILEAGAGSVIVLAAGRNVFGGGPG